MVILKLSLGSRICGEKIVVILQCLIGKKGEARGQSKNKQIFQYFITISAKDASFNKKWILGSVLEVLIDFFFNCGFQIKKLTGKFWIVSDTMAERACNFVINWLSSAGVTDLSSTPSLHTNEKILVLPEVSHWPMSLMTISDFWSLPS